MNLEELLEKTKNVRLVAASKYVDFVAIKVLFEKGVKEFGENQVQALTSKKESLKNEDIIWHFIGNLQSNKINLLLKQRPTLWQSCNGIKIARAVNSRLDYKLDCLLEINSANEFSKNGIESEKAIEEYLQIKEECKNLNLCGVMSIGALSDDEKDIIKSFENTFKIYEKLQKEGAKICSMGMSNDFELAIKCGSNMIRLGSILFN
ncbi:MULTISPECIES: YggS family pyridoxal phosphate-dependent enzyme [unclassified Campylobacter]|uniref:YggS family pyridoxal phosphate-dependent enzyme n=1 Tax=unclassified Campylobacter TaxID=2593542 RepID=UPI001238317D|nr:MULTISPECIES: YggS family pyridoxal phosphate-dependent enzyme [unclassified Campylobacter]KAA6226414.1 YggS family pyridoxal phosphate-dependent enzyme [Campylobacter sp. LR286c]KAA6226548.1 YggS family pyridoxal phosphate-dependent enzyme [Campylobacter sp. LR185c]KAA6226902.1 YggS family pyridoxal phosphate-dependent enzyme [Campylobacter sp. LR196d]KAA6233646.1 YggS family pyridoxal phosphate-dependent enzyme [Campylobacter sp. LR291e]KAA8603645.1 YggS family pyridoxal phosphate-depende